MPFPGCDTYGNGGATCCGKDGVFASSWAPSAQTVTPPSLSAADELALYNSASPGPMHPCGAGSTGTIPANLFDSAGSTTPDTSLGSKSFIALLGPNDVRLQDGRRRRLTWTPSGDHGAKACLHVRGTVFFDASLTMGGADYIQIDTERGRTGCTGATYPVTARATGASTSTGR